MDEDERAAAIAHWDELIRQWREDKERRDDGADYYGATPLTGGQSSGLRTASELRRTFQDQRP
jgi:hypothetical protein